MAHASKSLPPALAALGDYDQFILWREDPPIESGGKPRKVPLHPTGKCAANLKESANWLSADSAFSRADLLSTEKSPIRVGFVLTASDPFFCLDVDSAATGDGGWSPLVAELAQQLPGAAIEVSYSGRGLHIWGQAGQIEHACRNTALGLELYTEQRFIALGRPDATGNAAKDCTQTLSALIGQYFAPGEANGAGGDWRVAWEHLKVAGVDPQWNGPADDAELIAKAIDSRSANQVFGYKAMFTDLWTADAEKLARHWPGTYDGYDASSADSALAVHLAFWTGKDALRIERLMRQSKLVRDKWDEREDYLPRTILSACKLQKTIYGVETDTQPEPGVVPGNGLLETPGESTIAKVLKNEHEGEHCYSVNSKRWYSRELKKLWKFDEEATRLQKLILGYMEMYKLKRGNQIAGVIKFLKVELADWGQWDDDPNLCGLPDDRVLDLATGQVQPAKVTDRISRRLGAIPIQGTPTRWLQFLTETMPINESAAYISWLQVWFGYVLTGHTRERRFVFMSGSGGNGKSVLLDTLAAIMGDYAVTLQSAALFGEKQDHSEWKTKLDGPRLASVAEVSPGVKWKTVDLKEFTGGTGATIAARAMRQNTYNFSPTAKIIIVGNDRPDLVTVDNAIRDRIILLELDRRPARPDKKLIEKLQEEHGQILAWIVEGSQNYLRDGLPDIPASAKAATADYLSNEDQFSQFIEDCFAETPAGHVSNAEIWNAWATWSINKGAFRNWSIKRVGKELKKRNYQAYNSKGVRGFLGLTRKSIGPSQ